MKNIALFFGGKSCEHDISIITAMQARANFDEEKYRVWPIYVSKKNEWFLAEKEVAPKQFVGFDEKVHTKVFFKSGQNVLFKEGVLKSKPICQIDCAVIACHGLMGEDGKLQGVLEFAGVPYTSSGVCSSALSMDKVFMKQIFEVNNYPVAKYVWFRKKDYVDAPNKILRSVFDELEFPLVVKPANLGSSIGISVCANKAELEEAVNVAGFFDDKILVEEGVEHLREFNCAVIEKNAEVLASGVFEPATWEQFFDFDKKYIEQNTKSTMPISKKLPKYIEKAIKDMSKSAYKLFDCGGVVRLDFLYNDDTEELLVGEINSVPGSFGNYLFDKMSFGELLDVMICGAVDRKAQKDELTYSYESQVLNRSVVGKK